MSGTQDRAPEELVAGRYRLSRRLAHGGVGEVFVAHDESASRTVALKRVLSSAAQNATTKLAFMREYQLLAQLRHPRIIEVYDCGIHDGVPYYTMELLDGQDLAELAPLAPAVACRYLRDVASSLALIHARRLVHRDLSPRNVRRTSVGHCKLIDFGTVVAFGVAPNIAGTPPMIAPEALRQSVLDARTDLYSLGALAYYLLTGKYAYPVRDLAALSMAHMQPLTSPAKLVELPAAFEDLVMSLMSLDPGLRPRSAAEVIERLTSIGALGPDGLPSIARSFVVSPVLVGRNREQAMLEQQIKRGLAGEGSATLIVSGAGQGRSRLLTEAARLAQLRGYVTIEVFARGQRATESLSTSLVAALHRNAPEQARDAERSLTESFPHASSDVAVHAANAPTGEARSRLQAAMLQIFCGVARLRPLLIAIDDIEQADEFTLALIAALAHEATRLPLVIIASRASGSEERAFSALATLRRDARLLELGPLTRMHSDALVVSMFGEAPNVQTLCEWMFQAARGSPGLIVDLSQHLIDRGVVRYLDGIWALPVETIAEDIPHDLTQALALRLSRVGPMARSIAELMSVRRGGMSPLLASVACHTEASTVLLAFDELVQEGIFELAGDEYAFAQRSVREAVRKSLSVEREQALHTELAAALLASARETRDVQLEAGWHLLHTPFELRGAELLAEIGPSLVRHGLGIASALPAIEKALAVYERHSRPLVDRLRLRAELVLAGYLFDYRLGTKYGEETIELLYACSGLNLADRLRHYLPKSIALILAFAWFAIGRRFVAKRDRPPHIVRSLQYFGRSVLGLLGLRATALDAAGTRALVGRFYTSDSVFWPRAMRLVHLSARAMALQPMGREADLHVAVSDALVLASKGRPALMAEDEHHELLTGLLLIDGINECYREKSQALERATRLDALGTHLGAAGARRVRMIYCAVRGAHAAAERERTELELLAIQGGTIWQVEWFAAPIDGLVAVYMGDLVSTRRALDRLDYLLSYVPTLEPQRDAVRMGYHYLLGQYDQVAALSESFLAKHPPRSVIGWGPAYALIVISLAESGRAQQALAICDDALGRLSARDQEYFAMYTPLYVAQAWALALLGDRAQALYLMSATTNRLREAGEHAAVAVVLNYRARLAHRFKQLGPLADALQEMRGAALAAGSAILTTQADRWAQIHSAMLHTASHPARAAADMLGVDTTLDQPDTLAEVTSSEDDAERYRPALEILSREAGSDAAHLYLLHSDQAQHVATVGTTTPPLTLARYVAQLAASGSDSRCTVLELPANDTNPAAAARYHVVLLASQPVASAVALHECPDKPLDADRLLLAARSYLRTVVTRRASG